jgi:hypothetical protein
MLYLISCDFHVDLKRIVDDNFNSFEEEIFMGPVTGKLTCKYMFTISGQIKNLWLVITWDDDFIDKLSVLCTGFSFTCHICNEESDKMVSLYRIVGLCDKQYYNSKLQAIPGIEFAIIDDIHTSCWTCEDDLCDFGNSLIWIESTSQTPLPLGSHFDKVFDFKF